MIKKHVWKLEQRYKHEFAIRNKSPLLWYRFRWLDIGNVLENKNSKWSFSAHFTGAGYIWAMENHSYWYFPKLWKEHLCSSLSVSKRESLFVFKKREAKKGTFLVLLLGICTVLSAWDTRAAPMSPQNYCLDRLPLLPPLLPTPLWLLFTTIHWNSSCQAPQYMTVNPGDVF